MACVDGVDGSRQLSAKYCGEIKNGFQIEQAGMNSKAATFTDPLIWLLQTYTATSRLGP